MKWIAAALVLAALTLGGGHPAEAQGPRCITQGSIPCLPAGTNPQPTDQVAVVTTGQGGGTGGIQVRMSLSQLGLGGGGVTSLGGATGVITLGSGLSMVSNVLSSTGGSGGWTATPVTAIGTTLTNSGGTLGCTTATSSQIGCSQPDNATITISGGIITAIGGSATAIVPGTTTIGGATAPCFIENSSGTTMACDAVTGSGSVVLATSPTLVTPNLGTPTTLVATNATGTAASLTAGTATVANGLKSATTTVVVSAATAPTNGQVLTATGGSAATWQTPSSGGNWSAAAVSAIGSTLTNTSGTLGCTTATSSQIGCVRPDNSTISISGGVITSIGGSATSIVPGTTTIGGSTAPCFIENSSGTTMACDAVTGSGNVVLATSPTLVTPALGTPSALVATNATGTASGLTAGVANALGTTGSPVAVSAAAPPSTGQALIATGATTATWQTVTASASSITPGTTTIIGATAPCYIRNSSGTAMDCPATVPSTAISGSDRSSAVDPTITTTDMGNQINLTNSGSLTVVLPAKATGLWQPGQNIIITSQGAGAVTFTNSTTLTAAGTCTGISAGNAIMISANNDATHLDCQPLAASGGGGSGTVTSVNTTVPTFLTATGCAITTSGTCAITLSGTALPVANGGTGLTSLTFPTSGSTLMATTVVGQTFTGGIHPTAFSNGTASSGTTTIDCGNGPVQTLTNGGAFTLAMSANDGECIVRVTNNGSAGTITFSGFSQGSNSGDSLTTTNTNKFDVSLTRIGGNPHYLVSALQ